MKSCKTLILLVKLMLLSTISFSQSNYERGFRTGYVNGFCFDKTAPCQTSVPAAKSKSGTYRYGYSVGFDKGIKKRGDIEVKKYQKDFITVLNNLKSTSYTMPQDANLYSGALGKATEYYLAGDYEKTITMCNQLSVNYDGGYSLNLLKGMALLELEEFRDARVNLRVAASKMPEGEQKNKIDKTVTEIKDGAYKANKLKEEGFVAVTKDRPTPAAASPQSENIPIAKRTEQKPSRETLTIKNDNQFFNSGKKKLDDGHYAEAVADLTKAIDENAMPQAYYLRAIAKEKLGDNYGAANDFGYIVQAAPDNSINYAEVHFRYGNILLKQKKYDQAINEMNALIKLNDKEKLPQAFYNRGLAKINNNDKDGGCQDLSKAGELGYKAAYDAIKQFCN